MPGFDEIYKRKVFHGDIPISSKCHFCWNEGTLCLHQVCEIWTRNMPVAELMKRDFPKLPKKWIRKYEKAYSKPVKPKGQPCNA